MITAALILCSVIKIADGDTLTLRCNDSYNVRIRLSGIDAPEKGQPYGQKSKQSLSDICWDTDTTYEAQSIDRYGRTVALVYCNGIEANTEQVKRGFAWAYTKYNKDAALPALEQAARSAKVGLWSDVNPVEPWIYRKK